MGIKTVLEAAPLVVGAQLIGGVVMAALLIRRDPRDSYPRTKRTFGRRQ